jgi:signal transduction histidine kinase
MSLTKSYLLAMFILFVSGICVKASVEDVVKAPDTFACKFAPNSTLYLKGRWGKGMGKTYTFEDASRLEYKVKRDEYRECVRTPGKMSLEGLLIYKRNKPKNIIGAILMVIPFFMFFGLPLVYDYEEEKERKISEMKRAREAKAWQEQQNMKHAKRQAELVVERERSKLAHEARIERKRKKREELEARTKANTNRRKLNKLLGG